MEDPAESSSPHFIGAQAVSATFGPPGPEGREKAELLFAQAWGLAGF